MTRLSTLRSLCTALLFAVCAAGFSGCSGDSEPSTSDALSETARGWGLYDAGEYAQALLSFERAINFDENVADAHNGVGWSHLSLSTNTTLAQESFQNAVALDPSHSDAWVGLANLLFLRHKDATDFRSALRAVDNALAGDPTYLFRHDYHSVSELHALKAACYYYLGEDADATAAVEQTLQSEPTNRTALALHDLLKE